MTKNTAKVSSFGQVATFTKAIIKTMRDMVTARCFGLMAVYTKGNGSMASSMGWDAWYSQMAHSKKAFLKKTCSSKLCLVKPIRKHSGLRRQAPGFK